MSLSYLINIERPEAHLVKVSINGQRQSSQNEQLIYLPSWSPGSYLMREYARHVQNFRVISANGETLFADQIEKGKWLIDWEKSDLNDRSQTEYTVEYEVYCHELTVRTSHIDITHAFLHGPSFIMAVAGREEESLKVEVRFPAIWSKVSTALKDISEKRDIFLYEAENYDMLVDSPFEIGCHETDGFMSGGKPHELAFYGKTLKHTQDLKADIKVIVEHIADLMGEMPYDKYTFMTHFAPGIFGGLEHHDSTALQFDGTRLNHRKDYIQWLALVAHEYFHTWNVKRIRPIELGPFDYTNENYTKMLWLAEGLTSFMDEVLVLRAGLCNLEEYLEMQKNNLLRYFATPGRKFHSLEQSSFNAWIKLYRPDENSANSSMSYYLKGGIVFFILNNMLVEQGKNVNDLIDLLWKHYKADPSKGITKEEILQMIKDLGGEKIRDKFDEMISTTIELPIEEAFNKMGVSLEWSQPPGAYLGVKANIKDDRVVIASVSLDSPAYKAGLNAGDEIIAVDGIRILKPQFDDFGKTLIQDKAYQFLVARTGALIDIEVIPDKAPKTIEKLKVEDQAKAMSFLNP